MMAAAKVSAWPRIWDQLPVITDAADAVALINKVLGRRTEMLRAISACPNMRKAKRLSRRYMMSASARLACLGIAAKRKFGTARDRDAAAMALIASLDLVKVWAPAAQRMTAFPLEKLNGGTRQVFSSGVLDYARQLLTKDIVGTLTRSEPTQFMSAGGLPQFEKWLRKEIVHAQVVITTDIPSCFDRVLRDAVVNGLPLPVRVMREVLFRPMDGALYLEKTPRGLTPVSQEKVAKVSSLKRGIPQGSAVSSVASERVIGRIIRKVEAVSPDARVATFGDNLIILLRSADIEQSVRCALTSEVEACFGSDVIGELTRRTRVLPANQWFSFCGRDYRLKGQELKIQLSQDRIDKFAIKTAVDVDDALRANDRRKLMKADRSVMAWLRQSMHFPGALDEGLELAARIRASALYRRSLDDDAPPLVEAL